MLSATKLGKSFGDRILFSGVSFHVNRVDRIGVIGSNGSGKSTLFRLLLGELEPDEGNVVLRHGAVMGLTGRVARPTSCGGAERRLIRCGGLEPKWRASGRRCRLYLAPFCLNSARWP